MASHRIAKVNKHIQRTLGEILQQEADLPRDVLVTISRVDTTNNLRSAAIWLYIFPLEQGEDTLTLLESQLYELQGALNRRLHLKPLPRIAFKLDQGAHHASIIDQTLEDIS